MKALSSRRRKSVPRTSDAVASSICRWAEGGSRGSHSKWSETSTKKLRRFSGGQKKGWVIMVVASGLCDVKED